MSIAVTSNPPPIVQKAEAASANWWLLLAAGLVVRLALWCWWANLPIQIEDEQHYHTLATALVQRGEFGFEPGVLTSLRPPLYPAFLAIVYSVFGDGALQAVRFAQLLLSLATVVLVYQLGLAAFSARVGWWAAVGCCFYPSLLGANNLLLTETLFTFLFVLMCLLVVRAMQAARLSGYAWVGVVLGLGALTRSVLWLFPPVLSLFLLAFWPAAWRRRLLAAGVMCLTYAIVIAPWAVRNTRLQETLVFVDVMGGRNFMMGNYEHTPMFRAWDAIAIEGEHSWHAVLRRDYPADRQLTQGQIDKRALRAGLDYVKQHPVLSLQRAVIKFFCFWQLERELVAGAARGIFGPVNRLGLVALTAIIFSSYALMLWLGLFGMFLSQPSDRRIHGFLILAMAFVCGLHTLVFGHSRYHLPLMPLVMLYSASAMVHAERVWCQRRSWRFVMATCACLMFAAAWCYEIVVLDLSRFVEAVQRV